MIKHILALKDIVIVKSSQLFVTLHTAYVKRDIKIVYMV